MIEHDPSAHSSAVKAADGLDVDFDVTPFTVIWETTRACDLRCVHCRADAQAQRDPRELSTREGIALLDQIRELGSPVFVITGGDPLKRGDLFELIEHAVKIGLSVAVTPSGTPLLTADAVRRMHALGIKRMALSMDGPTPEIHDDFRQQPGSFAWTAAGLRAAAECGLPTQVNTTVTRRNWQYLPEIARVVADLGAIMWSVFFLVTVGRARSTDQLTAEEYEQLFEFLYETSRRSPFAVRSTAAPHYRRYVLQRETAARREGKVVPATRVAGMVTAMTRGMPRARRGVTDGNGLMFISHTGDVCPSGFLPLVVGNAREQSIIDLYRGSPLFRRLRDTEQLEGKCGVCEFRKVCAGSRARAFAVTGNMMAPEPFCAYEPRAWKQQRAGDKHPSASA